MTANLSPDSRRTHERLVRHYEVEKSLAARLRNASKADRQRLYQEVYNELYRLVPDHPMLVRKVSPEERAAQVDEQMRYLERFLDADSTFLEVGAGDCALSFRVAIKAAKVYGLEVSQVISEQQRVPDNFELLISNGTNVPVADGSVDVAYSNQLMEHLHPDDAAEQLGNICKALRPGGVYVCTTPHRFQGPTDISCLYDNVATGLHLKEYNYAELDRLFHAVGFARTSAFVAKSGRYVEVPISAIKAFEAAAGLIFGGQGYQRRQQWLSHRPFTLFHQGVNIVGIKS